MRRIAFLLLALTAACTDATADDVGGTTGEDASEGASAAAESSSGDEGGLPGDDSSTGDPLDSVAGEFASVRVVRSPQVPGGAFCHQACGTASACVGAFASNGQESPVTFHHCYEQIQKLEIDCWCADVLEAPDQADTVISECLFADGPTTTASQALGRGPGLCQDWCDENGLGECSWVSMVRSNRASCPDLGENDWVHDHEVLRGKGNPNFPVAGDSEFELYRYACEI